MKAKHPTHFKNEKPGGCRKFQEKRLLSGPAKHPSAQKLLYRPGTAKNRVPSPQAKLTLNPLVPTAHSSLVKPYSSTAYQGLKLSPGKKC